MIHNYMTQKAEEAAARYEMLIRAFHSLYDRTIANFGMDGPAWVNSRMIEARDIANGFLSAEFDLAVRELEAVAKIARIATIDELQSVDTKDLTDRALEHLSASVSYLQEELHAQVSRDLATLRKSIHRTSLEVDLAARSKEKTIRAALIERRLMDARGVDFVFHDRASRKWSSKTFVRTTWRHTLLSVYNETVLITLAEHGLSRAQVHHPDSNWRHFGEVVSMDFESGLPTYSAIREDFFHPNSDATLKPEDLHVSS